ncbi:hypothetical protein D3C77_382530 [compost metagenome]
MNASHILITNRSSTSTTSLSLYPCLPSNGFCFYSGKWIEISDLRYSLHIPLYLLNCTVRIMSQFINMWGTISFSITDLCLTHCLCMIHNIPLIIEVKYSMVIVSTHSKERIWIFQKMTLISKRSHRTITYHITNLTSRILCWMCAREVNAIRVVILSVIFMNTRILK